MAWLTYIAFDDRHRRPEALPNPLTRYGCDSFAIGYPSLPRNEEQRCMAMRTDFGGSSTRTARCRRTKRVKLQIDLRLLSSGLHSLYCVDLPCGTCPHNTRKRAMVSMLPVSDRWARRIQGTVIESRTARDRECPIDSTSHVSVEKRLAQILLTPRLSKCVVMSPLDSTDVSSLV